MKPGKLIEIGVIIFLIPLLSIQSAGMTELSSQNSTTHEYYEDFTQTTYEDASVSAAYGWGEGNLSLPRNQFTTMFKKSVLRTGDIFINESAIGVMNSQAGSIGIYNFSNPLNPSEIAQKFTSGSDEALFLYEDHVYIASGGNGIGIIDISDLSNLSDPVYVDTNLGSRDLVVYNDFVFVADGSSVAIFNVTDPSNPGPVIYQTADQADNIFFYNDFLYVTCGSRVGIIEVTDPTNPSGIFYIDEFGGYGLKGVYVENNLAFVAVDYLGLAIFNVTDPWNPSTPIFIDTDLIDIIFLQSPDIYVDNDVVILLISDTNNQYSGLIAIDVSNLNDLSKITWKELDLGVAYHLAFLNDYLYVTGSSQGEAYLIITNVKDILRWKTPVTAQSLNINLGGNVRNVTVQATQTVYPNTSITYSISFEKTTWHPVTLNETQSFQANNANDLYWRAILAIEGNQSQPPVIYSLFISYDVYVSPTTTTTLGPTTTIPTITVLPGETQICDFSWQSEFLFEIVISNQSGASTIDLQNLQRGERVEIAVGLISLGSVSTKQKIHRLSQSSESVSWQLEDPTGNLNFSSVRPSTTHILEVDQSGTWKLKFLWNNVTSPLKYSTHIRKLIDAPPPDVGMVLFLFAIAVLGTLGYFAYKYQSERKEKPITPVRKYPRPRERRTVVRQRFGEREEVRRGSFGEKESLNPIVTFEPKARMSFFCQLDNAQHPKTDSAYQCQNCSRMVCASCYEKAKTVGVPECPFCDGSLGKIQ